MDLLLLGSGTGVVGGLIPSPLHLIALAQVGLKRWGRAIFVFLAPALVIDGVLLVVTFFFYQYVPHSIAHYVAYVGGVALLAFGSYSLLEARRKNQDEVARSSALTYASVSVAALSELSAPGTWVYWLTLAGPIMAEAKLKGYSHVVPFFVGSLIGYYGAALLSLWVMAWGASLHQQFNQHLFFVSNCLLLVLGVSYLVRAYFGG